MPSISCRELVATPVSCQLSDRSRGSQGGVRGVASVRDALKLSRDAP